MGTCIRMIVERQNDDGTWKYVGHYYCAKNDVLSKRLAGVRLDVGDAITPVALPRGAPEGYELDELGDLYVGPKATWLGWHDHSWLLLSEVVGADELDEWSKIDSDFAAILDRAKDLGSPEKTRLVFGFDS